MHRFNFLYKADLTPFYQNRQCNEYGRLSLLGITFIFASRDSGVAGNGKLCLFPNGTQSEDAPLLNRSSFLLGPRVGATQASPGSAAFNPESTAPLTGGEFSNIFALPEYQQKAVGECYKYHEPPYGVDRYNISPRARGIPDFSVNEICTVVTEGRTIAVAGTSAESPVIGAIITLNDARLAAGKLPVGFINPAKYTFRRLSGCLPRHCER
ncbi:hypothetical protein B0H14DRAFT_3549050 [Mycena olivaceomarginata]|nr:hypothetical protein B0H14DRAFT_3549050 [Mycena olivaceomarginata]